jgi:hypothetical protein
MAKIVRYLVLILSIASICYAGPPGASKPSGFSWQKPVAGDDGYCWAIDWATKTLVPAACSGSGEATTFEVLDANGDVGTGAAQVAAGNHNHSGVYEPAGITESDISDLGTTVEMQSSMATDVPANEDDPVYGAVTTVSQVNAEAGTSTTVYNWTPQRVGQAIAALAGGGTDDQTAAEVSASTSNFAGNLSGSDDTVQKALDTLDDVAIPTASSLSVDDIITLSGVAEGAQHLGTFTGSTISDSVTIKAALQELETAVEGVGGGHDPITLSTDLGNNLLGLSTQQLTLDNQTANYVFAGPATGEAAAPAFRALVSGDIPDLSGTYLGVSAKAADSDTLDSHDTSYFQVALTNPLVAAGTQALTDNWDAGSFQIRAETFQSDVATGTAPFTVASTTEVTNLHAATATTATSATSATTAGNLSGTPALPNGTTATTQSQSDSSTKLATTAYVDTGLGSVLTNPMTTAGDIIYGGASGTPTRLGGAVSGGLIQQAVIEGMATTGTAEPGFIAYDSGNPGSDKEIGKMYWNEDGTGGDGSEDGDYYLNTMIAGSEVTIWFFDNSDDQWETSKVINSSGGFVGNLTGNASGSAGSVAVGNITGAGTGVLTALAVNVGDAGAPVVNGGALGTPSSGNASNLSNFPSSLATDTEVSDANSAWTGKPEVFIASVNPQDVYDNDSSNHQIELCPRVLAAFTVTRLYVVCDADPTTEPTITFQHKAVGVGYGSATTIEAVTTTAGEANVTSGIDDATVDSTNKIFATFSDPDDALTLVTIMVEGHY